MTKHETFDPLPSRASRKPARRTKGSVVGQLTFGEEHGQGQCLVFESTLELHTALLAIYAPGVLDVEDQVGPVTWTDASGKTRSHTFDFRVTTVSAGGMRSRAGLAVKPEHRAQRAKFRDEMERVTRAATPWLVDRVCIVTEANIDPVQLTRAKQLHGARMPVPEIDRAVAAVGHISDWMPVRDVLANVGLGPEGFGSILRLIRIGALMTQAPGLVSMASLVRNGEMPK
jgi:hypothetical protein